MIAIRFRKRFHGHKKFSHRRQTRTRVLQVKSRRGLHRPSLLVRRPETPMVLAPRRVFPLQRTSWGAGLLSQRLHVPILREQVESQVVPQYQFPSLSVPIRIGKPSASHRICAKRSVRRSVLFASGVAGIGKRRSPGRNGTYYRSSESETTCKK